MTSDSLQKTNQSADNQDQSKVTASNENDASMFKAGGEGLQTGFVSINDKDVEYMQDDPSYLKQEEDQIMNGVSSTDSLKQFSYDWAS